MAMGCADEGGILFAIDGLRSSAHPWPCSRLALQKPKPDIFPSVRGRRRGNSHPPTLPRCVTLERHERHSQAGASLPLS
jgi:hypothetical protein